MLSFEQRRDLYRQALQAKLGNPYSEDATLTWSIVATMVEFVVIDRGGKLYQLQATWDVLDNVTLGEPEPVGIEYRKLTEAAKGARILSPVISEGETKPGSRWHVSVIQEGISKNRTIYPADVLRIACPLYEGAKVFWNHSRDPMRDPRDMAGVIHGPRFALAESEGGSVGAIMATLTAIDDGLRQRLLEAHEAGEPDLFGLSHTVSSRAEAVRLSDGPALRVTEIRAVESVDVVSFPSAGGSVRRLVAGIPSPVQVTTEDLMAFDKKLAALKQRFPELAKKLSATPTETEVDALLLEAVQAVQTPEPAQPATPVPPPAPATVPAPAAVPAAAQAAQPATPQGVVLSESQVRMMNEWTISEAIRGRSLPKPMEDMLRDSLRARGPELTPEMARAEADRVVAAAGLLAEADHGSGRGGEVRLTEDEATKKAHQLDDFFLTNASPDVVRTYESIYGRKPDGPVHSFRSTYVDMTGDTGITGRLSEAAGMRRLTEALDSSTFAEVLGDSITRVMIAEGRTPSHYDDWRRIVSEIGTLSDFRTQHRTRIGGYGDLPTVAEAGTYQPLTSPGDEEATYSPAKKGGKESLTIEMIANDDAGVVRRIPRSLSLAARRTLYKAVMALLADNSAIYDSVALAASGHANYGTTALSETTLSAARLAISKQTNYGATDYIGLMAKTLIVPPDLIDTANRLIKNTVQPISAQTATELNINREAGLTEVLKVPHWTDANNWWVCIDPREHPTIEVGFYRGRQEPELYVADSPSVGAMFNEDTIEYKIRFIYGLTVLDYRGFYGAIVP